MSDTKDLSQRASLGLFAFTIFLSAFLLFSLEPSVARRILPWFGGSAAVWSSCLVFYQVALLAGYWYASLATQHLAPRTQAIVHVSVLVLSLALMPIGPGERWRPAPGEDPFWLIFRMLTLTIGLPFAALSATGPLLQSWLGRSGFEIPYRMFSVSNFASLAALLAYPLLIEPLFGTRTQSYGWSFGYVLFAGLCSCTAWLSRHALPSAAAGEISGVTTPPFRKFAWFALAACGSMLLLAVTNHIDENVASVPLLWIPPLAIYLLSFVLSFGSFNIYRPALWTRLLPLTLGIIGYAVYDINSVIALPVSLSLFLGGLFICCLFCHGELNRLRPPAAELTRFYLLIAAGGAAGAVFVGLVAPALFHGIYELPVALIATSLAAGALIWRDRNWNLRLLWLAVTAAMVAVLAANVAGYRQNSVTLRRSFYGSLRVTQTPHAGPEQQRILFHGTIQHGAQFLLPPRRLRPTTYYGPDSGIGILLRECFAGPKQVAVVGLGVGTLAAYGRERDSIHFYEINPQISEIAQSLFTYLRESRATTQITIGDGRLMLAQAPPQSFDVIALDAFAGDAIPVHLLTREAMALYLHCLRPQGVVAFHVSNDYLDLAPVVQQLARSAGLRVVLVHSHGDDEEGLFAADWVLVTDNTAVLENAAIKLQSKPIEEHSGQRLWTDDYSNLLATFKRSEPRR